MPSLYLSVYRPLACTAAGRRVAREQDTPPFVDGSIRREPDLEHDHPSITGLCHGELFAPRLCVGDVVVFLAAKLKYPPSDARHRRLTAALRVLDIHATHEAAANWYRARGLRLPSNCMVASNPPRSLDESLRRQGCSRLQSCGDWDAAYWERAAKCSIFVVCEPMFRELSWDAPVVTDADLVSVFGRVPGMLNPGRRDVGLLMALMQQLGIALD